MENEQLPISSELEFEFVKKTVCMPTHLPSEVAEHIATQAYERA